MARNWTDNQLDAINARGGCVIVSAAAGSGKTAVLVERVIRLITDTENGVDADRLLVVTYTRKAAAELRTRLREALSECIHRDPSNAFLIRQQSLLSKAQISTVDSFCMSLVREYYYLLDVDRNIRIADDGELKVLRADAMRLTLDSLYAEADPKFHRLVDTFATARDDSRLEDNIFKLYDFLRSHPFPSRWMDEKLSYYTDFTDVSDTVWGRIIGEYIKEAVDYLRMLCERGLDTIALDDKLYANLFELFDRYRIFVERLTAAVTDGGWDDIRSVLTSFEAGKFNTPKGYKDHPLKIAAASARDTFKDTVKTLSKLYSQDAAMCLYDIERLKDYAEQIFKAAREFEKNFSALKKERGVADYSDIEHWALRLVIDEETLERTAAAQEIAARFDCIMVDEYQDANEVQDTFFKAVSRNEDNLFVVGDVKQSIYGFRQAMPELFLKRKNTSTLYDRNDPVYPAKIILEKNFRSDKEVLAAANFFFSKLMSPQVGDIDYNEEERLFAGAEYEPQSEPAAELDIIDKDSSGEDDAAVAEARLIAERILTLVSEGYRVKDGDTYRPATFSDFAVLMRNLSGYGAVYREVFEQYGIHAHSESKAGFLGAREIMLITNFLRVINNPALDIELLSVLMSPVFAFDEDDLTRIRLRLRKGSLYAAVTLDAESGDPKSKAFLKTLSYYRELSVTMPLYKLITVIYERSSFSAASESGGDFGVELMTVHASKGLEFPVCIVANTARRMNSDTTKAVLLHSRYGYAQKLYDPALSASYNTMPRTAISMEIARDEMSEELRILYVAMTRAKQKLIMVSTPSRGAASHIATAAKKLAGQREISPFAVRSAGSLSEWIVMCALLHPDGKSLRDYAGVEADYEHDSDFRFACRVIDTPFDQGEPADEAESRHIPEPNAKIIELLEADAAYRYPYDELSGLPAKVAASTLAHSFADKTYDRYLSRPAFMQDEKLTSAEKGTALHAFMQYADFAAAREDIKAELDRLTESGYLTSQQADSIDLGRASGFINSPLVTRCLGSDRVYKEYRFNITIPAAKVDPDIDQRFADEPIILQGAVDLAFVEDGRLVIVDYKTDRVKEPSQLALMYSAQLMLYKDALEQCLGLPVKECVIYSVRHSAEVSVYSD